MKGIVSLPKIKNPVIILTLMSDFCFRESMTGLLQSSKKLIKYPKGSQYDLRALFQVF